MGRHQSPGYCETSGGVSRAMKPCARGSLAGRGPMSSTKLAIDLSSTGRAPRAGWAPPLLAFLASCTGTISAPFEAEYGSSEDDGAADTGGAGGKAGVSNKAGRSGGTADAACMSGVALGPAYLRRLTNREYDATVRDLLGYTGAPSSEYALLADPLTAGFDNNAETIGMSTPALERYESAARGIAKNLTADESKLRAFAGCDPTVSACLTDLVERLGRRAFRRPLAADESRDLLALANGGTSPAERVSQVLTGLLMSPSFLFRTERGEPDDERPGLLRLSGHETATRLSYLLTGTMPNDRLLDTASAGGLRTADQVATAAKTLMESSAALAHLTTFYTQWFRLQTLRGATFEPKKYPGWSEALGTSMAEETSRFVAHLMFTPGADLLDVLDANWTILDERLAKHYGVAPPSRPWDRVELPLTSHRAGLLTHGSVLALTSKPDHASGILRGKYVREVVLCTPIPSPPPDIPPLSAPVPGETERQRFERHTKDAACAGCHRLIDPVGFGLSHYDAIGAYRDRDELGQSVDARGNILLSAGLGVAFEGGIELGRTLRAQPEVGLCVATHLLRFGLGRRESEIDECTLSSLAESLARSGNSFRDMLVAFVRSDAFRYRLPAAAQKGDGP